MDWPKLLLMNWPAATWARTNLDIEDAAEEIRHTIHRDPPSNDELCAALRWLSGPECKQEKPPSLRELIRAVFIRRKQGRVDDSPVSVCAICCEGWLDVHSKPDDPEYVSMVPCRCARGNALIGDTAKEYASLTPEQLQRVEELRDKAIAEVREIHGGSGSEERSEG